MNEISLCYFIFDLAVCRTFLENDINPVNKRHIAIANARASLAQNIKVV